MTLDGYNEGLQSLPLPAADLGLVTPADELGVELGKRQELSKATPLTGGHGLQLGQDEPRAVVDALDLLVGGASSDRDVLPRAEGRHVPDEVVEVRDQRGGDVQDSVEMLFSLWCLDPRVLAVGVEAGVPY